MHEWAHLTAGDYAASTADRNKDRIEVLEERMDKLEKLLNQCRWHIKQLEAEKD